MKSGHCHCCSSLDFDTQLFAKLNKRFAVEFEAWNMEWVHLNYWLAFYLVDNEDPINHDLQTSLLV
jgi:hypothetical protein